MEGGMQDGRSARTNFRLLVFLTSLGTLMFELVASRLADFHLGAGNAYLAIPVTFLGLALGSVHVHARPKVIERFDPVRAATVLAALCLVSMLGLSIVFSRLLPVVSALQETEHRLYLFYKTLAFIGVLLLPFYYFGRILTVAYQLKRDEIGAIYSADFVGAALACALTPLLFHFGGLPNVSLVLLGVTCIPVLAFFRGSASQRTLVGLLLIGTCIVGQQTMAAMDGSLDYRRYEAEGDKSEIAHGWNEHSRVAVLEQRPPGAKVASYKIVHDNSRSNVHVFSYRPGLVGRGPTQLEAIEVPLYLGRPIQSALVMFAGCGAEMIRMNEYFGGKAKITGVELNPLVRDLALETPELKNYRLQEFYDLPQIDLVIDEGRHFLSRTSDKYDLIFIGSNADTAIWLTGHSRKYLDTAEAFHLFLDHLTPKGIIVFDHQPVDRRLETMKMAFAERGIPGYPERVMVLASIGTDDDLIVSPSGFTNGEILRIVKAAGDRPERVKYAPRRGARSTFYARRITGPVTPEIAMTDDRPFLTGLLWSTYELIPTHFYLDNYFQYVSWIKITTLFLLIGISTAFIALIGLRPSSGLPPAVLLYLLITGFCFMLIEIALMAKLELFLQQPLVSMATVLSTFLFTSGVGSWLFPRVQARLRIDVLALVVALFSVGSIYGLDFLAQHLLGYPIGLRLVVAAVVVAPVGLSLGLFYPYAVSCLVRHGRSQAVALTYGISTLSSVIGATYGMTMMLDRGFANLLWQAAVGYVVLALFYQVYATGLKRRFLTL